MKIKIIDLLNLVYKKKAPTRILYKLREYVFDADIYSREQAIEIYFDEMCCETDNIEDVQIEEEYVKWKPNLSKDEMWHFDLEEKQGMYLTCNKDEKGAFKCWKVFI